MDTVRPEIAEYASALLALGRATDSVERLSRELAESVVAVFGQEEFRSFMADPAVAPEGKSDAVVQLLATRVHHVLLSFLLVLVRENRWRDAPAIAGRFARIARGDGDGVESGEVVTAVPLDPGRVAAIEKEVGRILGRDVRLRAVVNPDVVGGVAVHAGGFAVDGTVERMLRDARQALLER